MCVTSAPISQGLLKMMGQIIQDQLEPPCFVFKCYLSRSKMSRMNRHIALPKNSSGMNIASILGLLNSNILETNDKLGFRQQQKKQRWLREGRDGGGMEEGWRRDGEGMERRKDERRRDGKEEGLRRGGLERRTQLVERREGWKRDGGGMEEGWRRDGEEEGLRRVGLEKRTQFIFLDLFY